MKVYLVRHGQTNYNVAKLHNDNPSVDVFLTELGKKQARAVTENLKNAPIEHIFISELKRTRQTADIINKYHGVPVSIDPRLNDNKSGFEGKPDTEYYDLLEKAQNRWAARFNDGESLNDVRERVQGFMAMLRQTKYKTCVIVTSRIPAQFFYAILRDLTNEEAWNFEIGKGACLELELN